MLFRESETIELKEIVVDEIKKEIIAFANCDGGKLYIGVQDNGTVVGVNNPEGVYVRQGCSSVPAADTAIRRMIKETDGNRFEAMRCLNQELTFEVTEREFELRNIEFGPQQMRTLKLVDQDNLYSNLGLLLSDQCVHIIKVAVFQGTDQTVFKDRREFTGSSGLFL